MKNNNYNIFYLFLTLFLIFIFNNVCCQTWITNGLTEKFTDMSIYDIEYNSNKLWILSDYHLYEVNGDSAIILYLDSFSSGPISNYYKKKHSKYIGYDKFARSKKSLFLFNQYLMNSFLRIYNDTVTYASFLLNENEKILFIDTDEKENIYFLGVSRDNKLSKYFMIQYNLLNNQYRNELITLDDSMEIVFFTINQEEKMFILRSYNKSLNIYRDNLYYDSTYNFEDKYSYNLNNGFKYDNIFYKSFKLENKTYLLSSNGKLLVLENRSIMMFRTTLVTNGACFWFMLVDNFIFYTDNQGFKKYDYDNNILSVIETDVPRINIASTGYKFRNIVRIDNYIYGINGAWDQRIFCNVLSNGIRIYKFK